MAGLAAAEALRAADPATVAGCSAAAGLSLGEYTALVWAGALSFEDGLKVLYQIETVVLRVHFVCCCRVRRPRIHWDISLITNEALVCESMVIGRGCAAW